jgi:Holliday junction resolvase-like predicted endonuclease
MERFIVAHNITFKYGNIDHLVIRDDGRIFLIETKAYRGNVTTDGRNVLVNGRRPTRNPICQMQRTIRFLKRHEVEDGRRSMWITAIIIAPFARDCGVRMVGGVHIISTNIRKLVMQVSI